MENPTPRFPLVHISDFEPVSPDVLALLPKSLVVKNMIVPVAYKDGRAIAAVARTDVSIKPEGLRLIAGCPVELVLAPIDEITAFIRDHYEVDIAPISPVPPVSIDNFVEHATDAPSVVGAMPEIPETTPCSSGDDSVADITSDKPSAAQKTAPTPPDSADAPPVIEQPMAPLPEDPLDRLVEQGVRNRATEILVDGQGGRVRVRQRIRGILVQAEPISMESFDAVTERIRNSADRRMEGELRWFESRRERVVGQDRYRCAFVLSETRELRLLTIRVAKWEEKPFHLTGWGMDPFQANQLENLLGRDQGVILFCGPSDDPVADTLNGCARAIAAPNRHTIAVLAQPDGWLAAADSFIFGNNTGLLQRQLAAVFEHDPDVMVVNPLEEKESFELCLKQSLKGPLVLGRTYARDAIDAVVNLLMMGVEPYLISSGLLGIVAQRRLRLICPQCQTPEIVPHDQLRELSVPAGMAPETFFHGAGCDQCAQTGFNRETNIFEVLAMTDELKSFLLKESKAEAFRQQLKSAGMLTLRQVAMHKAINGQTSLSEVVRLTTK